MPLDTSQVRRLAAALEGERPRIGRDISQKTRRRGERVLARAKATVRVDTGETRDQANMRVFGNGNAGFVGANVGSDLLKGLLLEVGTARQPPTPWLQPSLNAEAEAYVAELEKSAGELLR